jgi:tetratricopeptide (TPR) repeat protein
MKGFFEGVKLHFMEQVDTIILSSALGPHHKRQYLNSLELGHHYMKRQKYEKAIEYYHKCLKEMKSYCKRKGITEFSENDVDQILLPVLCKLATCYLELKDNGKATHYASQALSIRPHYYKAETLYDMAYDQLVEEGHKKRHSTNATLSPPSRPISTASTTVGGGSRPSSGIPSTALSKTVRPFSFVK